MARPQLPQTRRPPTEDERPPNEGQGLDDWFTQRLESHGIPSRFPRTSITRLMTLVGFAVALLGLIWAFSVAGGDAGTTSPSSTPTSTPATGKNAGKTTKNTNKGGAKKTTAKAVSWRNVPVDVLNGFGGSGAATAQQTLLTANGWQVRSTGNAGATVAKTIVVYTPGNRPKAVAVAKKIGVDPPVAVASVTGLDPTVVSQVAIVLGPNLLPAYG
jgi:hypothetical protein